MKKLLLVFAMILSTATVKTSIAAVAGDATKGPARFPEVTSENLEKKSFHLPHDFAGERNLLFVAFEREQQEQIDTWLKEVKGFKAVDAGLEYYEIPTIDQVNPVVRWFINRGMRGGIPDLGARERTITLYIDKTPFKESLQIPSESTIYVFVVNKTGEVLWRSEGSFSEAKGASLLEYLRSDPLR